MKELSWAWAGWLDGESDRQIDSIYTRRRTKLAAVVVVVLGLLLRRRRRRSRRRHVRVSVLCWK